jgi:toxin ParE1/3/4
MPAILRRPRAGEDLAEIWEYIAEDSEEQADAFLAAIDRKFQVLADRPGMGRARDELAEGLRSFPVGKYVVFYRPIPGGIEIIRVLHGARDMDAILDADD